MLSHDETEGWESLQELLREAEKAGFQVSRYQLERWRQRDLLPSPTKRGLGRGKGTISLYPPGTTDQLVALLRFKQQDRRLDAVGWRLWGAGYSVVNFVRPRLTEFFQRRADVVRENLQAFEQGEPSAISRADDLKLPRKLDGLRRRTGGKFPTIVRIFLEIVGGVFSGEYLEEDSDDFALIAKVLDKPADQLSGNDRQQALLDALGSLSRVFDQQRLADAARAASQDELAAIRDQALSFWQEFSRAIKGQVAPLPPYGFFLWFIVRKTPELNDMAEMLAQAPEWEETRQKIMSPTGRGT